MLNREPLPCVAMGKHRAVAAPVGAGHRPPGDGGELMAPFAVSPGGILSAAGLCIE
jgi:hypothetical protein